MKRPKTIEDLKSDLGNEKYIILEEELEYFNSENIDTTINLIEEILKKYPNLDIRIVRNIERKDNSYENITNIKNKLLSNNNLSSEERLFIQTPGMAAFKKNIQTFDEDEFRINETIYSMKEIYESEKIFNLISSSIEKDNFTNFEKILACYMIVVLFKDYKEVKDNNYSKSRSIYSILTNDYIVCEGYSRFLNYILGKLNIKSSEMIYMNIKGNAHAVSIIDIDDDDYGIHGKFIFDPTAENYLKRKNNTNEFRCPITYFAHSISEFENSHNGDYIGDLNFINSGEELMPLVIEDEDLYESVSSSEISLDKFKLCLQNIYSRIFNDKNILNDSKFNTIIDNLLNQRKIMQTKRI